MAFVGEGARSKLPSILAVALVHGAIGYAFISGLAYTVIQETFPVFRVESIADTPPPPNIPPPPSAKQPEARVTAADPLVRVTASADPMVVPLPPLERTADPIVVPPAEPMVQPPPPAMASAVRPKGDKAAWITTDDYPSAALRNGEEGIVGINATIDSRGRVSGCEVTRSSGSVRLDEATCRIYARRARFAPAIDPAGTAVPATFADRVRWQIPR